MPARPPEAAIPILRRYVGEAYSTANSELNREVSLREDDHLGFMASCFAHKQLNHAKSAILLLDSSQDIDAVTVARVMLEGLILVAWAALAPNERPLRWRAYSLVNDWKLLLAQEAQGNFSDAAKKKELAERLRDYSAFLTSGARKHGVETVTDPYQSTWRVNADGSKAELKVMVDELGDPGMKLLYDDLSQVSHWTPRGVAVNMRASECATVINFRSFSLSAMAYAVVFLALTQTLLLFTRHFERESATQIERLMSEYVAELSPRRMC